MLENEKAPLSKDDLQWAGHWELNGAFAHSLLINRRQAELRTVKLRVKLKKLPAPGTKPQDIEFR